MIEIASYRSQGTQTVVHMMIRGAGQLQARHPVRNPPIPGRDGIALRGNRGPKADLSRQRDLAIAKRARHAVRIGEMTDRTIQESLEIAPVAVDLLPRLGGREQRKRRMGLGVPPD